MRKKKELSFPEITDEFRQLDEIYRANVEKDPYIYALNDLENTKRNLFILYVMYDHNATSLSKVLKVSNSFILYTIKPIIEEIKQLSKKYIDL